MKSDNYTFIDLFAGIGGIRIAFEELGATCVFSSEYDKYSQKTYKAFFGESPDFHDIDPSINPPGDITKLSVELIPDHDILTGGFPCQPFSLAGVSKKQSLGKPHGFSDPTQGTLFFNIKRILEYKQPKAFLLENVKNLLGHDKGNTFRIIRETLNETGYFWDYRIINAAGWIPQHRERIYIAGFRKAGQSERLKDFSWLKKLLPPENRLFELDEVIENEVPEIYTLKEKTWDTLERHKAYHLEKGNGFGYSLVDEPYRGKITRTLSARYYKDGAEILIKQEGKRPRRLTPLECCRLMGFPEKYQAFFNRKHDLTQPVSDSQAYKQFGNSVAVPVINQIADALCKKLDEA